MSFDKFKWVDRLVAEPNRRTIVDTTTGEQKTANIYRDEGEIQEEGTPFSEKNMNGLEDRIAKMFPVKIEDGGTGTTDASGVQGINVGKRLTGMTVTPTEGSSVVALEGAEIFGDYRERTFSGGIASTGNISSGEYSYAEGYATTSSGRGSHAEGRQTQATSAQSHAEGYKTISSGGASHSEGYETKALAVGSHSEGQLTEASKDQAHAEGYNTTADGAASHAEGTNTTASGEGSHTEGYNTNATNTYAHAEGDSTTASGNSSHSEGYNTTASGKYAHAEGNTTTASNEYSHAEGNSSTASGKGSHAEGFNNSAEGENSHAEGVLNRSVGENSHTEGASNWAGGEDAHAEGCNNSCGGRFGHVEGWHCNASSGMTCNHAGGYYTLANNYQRAIGRCNTTKQGPTSAEDMTGTLLVIGNGTNENSRSNAFRVETNGNVYAAAQFHSSGAGLSEMFEWSDGNINNEDRRGLFVTLDGEKIRIANPSDSYILGVIDPTPFVIGDSQSEQWKDRYLKDVFGEKLTETIQVTETIDELGNIIPAHTETRYILNPEYNGSKEYINRETRKEFAPITSKGKVVMIDDGTCKVNKYCKVGINGVATYSEDNYKVRVLNRIDNTHIYVYIDSVFINN